ncbi:MAG: DNA-binding protein [Erysipelotrichaceae bacterium]|nr:DNA-binding protein [Erysipelotrichaceae bacterium]MBO4538587.1 DNA-binding protein [Erysipelotrichaceae bacterium]MBR5048323.1 DNA-binding protein [Erysipelotrichaceae bacterium]
MEYKRIDNVIIARIDRGEEIVETLRLIAERENVTLANINALGAVDDFTVGVYNVDRQQYFRNDFQGAYEIVSLTGSVNTMDGEYYSHLHMCAADEEGRAFGGHLNRAVVSATCEMFIYVLDGTVDRFRDPLTGLNLFKF